MKRHFLPFLLLALLPLFLATSCRTYTPAFVLSLHEFADPQISTRLNKQVRNSNREWQYTIQNFPFMDARDFLGGELYGPDENGCYGLRIQVDMWSLNRMHHTAGANLGLLFAVVVTAPMWAPPISPRRCGTKMSWFSNPSGISTTPPGSWKIWKTIGTTCAPSLPRCPLFPFSFTPSGPSDTPLPPGNGSARDAIPRAAPQILCRPPIVISMPWTSFSPRPPRPPPPAKPWPSS